MTDTTSHLIRLSQGPLHHFFGYYGIPAWDPSATRHLALETTFHEHRPTADDTAKVGLLDSITGEYEVFGSTPAFNLQQGSMMSWIGTGDDTEFTYNDWQDGRLVSQAINLLTRERRTLDGALAAVDVAHHRGVSLNFGRMSKCRAVVGYDLLPPGAPETAPDDDGLWGIDLDSGNKQLLLSFEQMASESSSVIGWPGVDHGAIWFNHITFSPNGERMVFLTRVLAPERPRGRWEALWVMNSDGSNLRCLLDYRRRISHFAWLDDNLLICSDDACDMMQFTRINVSAGTCEPWGVGYMPQDGHACPSPDGQWIACDTYPGRGVVVSAPPEDILDLAGQPDDDTGRTAELFIYNPREHTKIILARPVHDAKFTGDIRCDLHPRWRQDGHILTIDSVHEGSRQIYAVDVSRWTK